MSEIEHAGLGAAYLRSHPGVPIVHDDGAPCDYCRSGEPAPRVRRRLVGAYPMTPDPHPWRHHKALVALVGRMREIVRRR